MNTIINFEKQIATRECVERVKPRRKANGLPLIVPLPGAYDAMDESEL